MLISWKLDRKFHYPIYGTVGAHAHTHTHALKMNLDGICRIGVKNTKKFQMLCIQFSSVCRSKCVRVAQISTIFSFCLLMHGKKTVIFRLLSAFINQFSSTHNRRLHTTNSLISLWYFDDVSQQQTCDVYALFEHSYSTNTDEHIVFNIGTQINNYHLVVAL